MEEKLNDLDKRLAALEKIEKRRKLWNRINLGFKLLVFIALAIVFFKVYSTLKTYKQKLDQITNLQEKLNTSETFLQEQIDKLDTFNIFK